MHSYCDIDNIKIFGNVRLNLHIVRIAQGWQSGIIQILKEHTSEVWKRQKKLCTDPIARLSKNLGSVNRTKIQDV